MRPEVLNPLFTEVEALKGVGPQVAKLLKRLDITRVVDLLYHLPTGSIERVRAPAASAGLLGRAARRPAARRAPEPARHPRARRPALSFAARLNRTGAGARRERCVARPDGDP